MTQPGFDLLFDRIVEALEKYSLEQPILEDFKVEPDSYESISGNKSGTFVCVYMGTLRPTQESRSCIQYATNIIIEPVVIAKRQGDIKSDRVAGKRLRCLIQQVLDALFLPENIRFGFDEGEISLLKMPTIEPLPPDKDRGDLAMTAARMVLEFDLAWEVPTVSGTPLEEFTINADKWSALFK